MSGPNDRMDDEEILFTTLILMFGEPPRLPRSYQFQDKLNMVHKMKEYSRQIKDMMGEMGHDPNQGLYTSFIYFCDHEWKSAAERRLEKEAYQARAYRDMGQKQRFLG